MSISERDLVDWLLGQNLAELDDDGRLRPTRRCVELGGSLQPLRELIPA